MSRKQKKFHKLASSRSKTCEGNQDTSLEVHPQSDYWKRLADTLQHKVELRPGIYREGLDLVDNIATVENLGHNALASELDMSLRRLDSLKRTKDCRSD